jgi:hypothetical protein
VVVLILIAGGNASQVYAQDRNAEIEALKQQVEELRRRENETQRQLEELQRRLDTLQAQPAATVSEASPASALDKAVQELEATSPQPTQATKPSLLSTQVGGATLRLIDLSADILIGAGGSTRSNEEIELLQGGGHDPRRNGFTLQALELSMLGAIDPYFTGEAHVVFFIDAEGETKVELEEAFLTTQSLPYGLQIESGFFFTEFGLINPAHPHAWDWVDQPVVLSRFFGEDGMRQAGMRVGWLTPLPWFSEFHVGVQNPNGETMVSFLANDEVFEERATAGRPFTDRDVDGPEDLVYLLRWVNSWELGRGVTTKFGLSSLFGPNPTGSDARTLIYGADLKLTWRPARNYRGWPFLRWQTEFLHRDYEVASFMGTFEEEEDSEEVSFSKNTLNDWGLYTQLLYGFTHRWAAGLRFEYATGSGTSVGGRQNDPFRDDRFRFSPLLTWYASEFARLRLQYNLDDADHLDGSGMAHSVWLVLEGFLGAHPAHQY